LGDEGFYTFLAMVGHCMKDSGEDCFEFPSIDDMVEGKLAYVKFGKACFMNHVNLTHSHIQRAYQWTRLCMKKYYFICVKVDKFIQIMGDSFEVHKEIV
jgi:hypothetical protein